MYVSIYYVLHIPYSVLHICCVFTLQRRRKIKDGRSEENKTERLGRKRQFKDFIKVNISLLIHLCHPDMVSMSCYECTNISLYASTQCDDDTPLSGSNNATPTSGKDDGVPSAKRSKGI